MEANFGAFACPGGAQAVNGAVNANIKTVPKTLYI